MVKKISLYKQEIAMQNWSEWYVGETKLANKIDQTAVRIIKLTDESYQAVAKGIKLTNKCYPTE